MAPKGAMAFSNQSLGISMAPKGAMTFSKQILSCLDRKLFFAKQSLANLKGFWNENLKCVWHL